MSLRILITGAGLVGCFTALDLIKRGHEVILVDVHPDKEYIEAVTGDDFPFLIKANVCDVEKMLNIVRQEMIEVVVHTAGLVGQKAERNPYLAFKVNGEGTSSVAEACRIGGVRRLIHISSLAVYDWHLAQKYEAVPETNPSGPSSVYGSTKVAAETVIRSYAAKGWLETVILRLAGTYGFGRFRGGSKLGFIIQQVLIRSLKGQFAVLPSGLGTNEYLYVKDVSQAIRLAIHTDRTMNTIYNIGTGRLDDPHCLAKAIKQAIPGALLKVKPNAEHRLPLDVSKAKEELGFSPQFELVDGLADMAQCLIHQPLELAREADSVV